MSSMVVAAAFLVSFVAPMVTQQPVNFDDDKRFIGACSMEDVLNYSKNYADSALIYIPDPDALDVFRQVTKPVTIKMFYRTDCSDSIREVPRFIKTIQEADNDNIKVECIGVNLDKDEPADLVAGWEINLVPTFIVIFDGEEVGRVVERPYNKIEIDLAEILNYIR